MAYDKLVDSAELDATFKGIADAIRDKTGSTEQISQNDMAEKILGVYESGHTAGVAEGLVEGYANGQAEGVKQGRVSFLKDMNGLAYFFGTTTGYTQNMHLLDEVLQSDLSHIGTAYSMFINNLEMTEVDLPETFNPTTTQTMFAGCKNLVRVSGMENMNRIEVLTRTFYLCSSLADVGTIGICENTTTTEAFASCSALEEVRIAGVIGQAISFANSSKLSIASVDSIIDHLKDLTGQTAKTLTFHATVGGKLTDAQKATITAKNWTLVY